MSKVTEEIVDVAFDAGVVGGNSPAKMLRDGLQALFDAKLISLPVDEAAIREAAIKECIAAVGPTNYTIRSNDVVEIAYESERRAVIKRLEALIPKDRAKELAEEWWNGGWRDGTGCYPSSKECAENAFRWLIEREGANG